MSDGTDAVFDVVTAVAPEIRDGLAGRREYEAAENPSGEQMLAADIHADELLKQQLLALDSVASYASEERDGAVESESGGDLHVACDPLDGSSNLQSNNGLGTIVGVYNEPLPAGGDAMVAAGYVLYGPITTMLVAQEGTVTESLLEDGEREVLDAAVSIPSDPVVYGFGGRVPDWPSDVASYVAAIEDDRLKRRYSGAMVGDVNQVVTYGGIFGYPMLTDRPEGKLRLQFEGHPIAHIIETMGGASTDGHQSLLATTPERLHERTPVFVGNEELIERLEAALAE